MEHYRSTLATTAIAALGLFVAAHVLHPGNYERVDRRARVVKVAAEAPAIPTSGVEPLRRLQGSEPAMLMADSAALLVHGPTVVLPPGKRMFPRLSSKLVAPTAQKAVDSDPIGDLIRNLDLDQDS